MSLTELDAWVASRNKRTSSLVYNVDDHCLKFKVSVFFHQKSLKSLSFLLLWLSCEAFLTPLEAARRIQGLGEL